MTPSGPGAGEHSALWLKAAGTGNREEAPARPESSAARQGRGFGVGAAK